MTGAFIILVFTVVVGVILYLFDLRHRRRHPEEQKPGEAGAEAKTDAPQGDASSQGDSSAQGDTPSQGGAEGECCGLHLVCEKDSLSPVSDEILYYDDEELDRFIGRSADSYTPQEVEEFRDVLMTLQPSDIAGWARSITQRRLELPSDVRDELLMLVNEQRHQKS